RYCGCCRGTNTLSSFSFLLGLQLFFTLAFAAFGLLPCTLLGNSACLFRFLPRLLFFGAPQILGLQTLALAALVFNTLHLEASCLFDLATLGVDFVLLLAGLLFEHVPLDVRPL